MRWLVLVLLLGVAMAQCEFDTLEAESYETVYEVIGEDAMFTIVVKIPMEMDCLEELGLAELEAGSLPCSDELTAQIYDPIYEGTGQLPAEPTCEMSYADGKYILEGEGRIIMFVAKEGARYTVDFPKWQATPLNATDTLKIILPQGAETIEYVPRKDSTLDNNTIYWSTFPGEKPEIVYTMPVDYTVFAAVVAGAALLAVLFFVLSRHTSKKSLDRKEKEIKAQMKQIQYQYMKRKIDGPMFRSLMEKAVKELTEVQTRKKMWK